MSKRESRLAKLEAGNNRGMSERVKAWFGLRPALTAEEEAAGPKCPVVDLYDLSPELREWLSRRSTFS